MSGRIESVEDFLSLLKGVKRTRDNHYLALCPVHNDRTPSLSITELPDKILVNCLAGCHINAVLSAIKLEIGDLFLNSNKPKASTLRDYKKIDVTYDYHDKEGNVLFQVVRFKPKSFAQRHPGGEKGWIWGLRGVKPIIYHLPQVKEAIVTGETIFLPEGEKDVDNIISQLGVVATTAPMGAGKWRDDYAKMLVGAKEVVVIADNDLPGRRHAWSIAASLLDIQVPTKLLEMPSEDIKDISDWISCGLTADQLKEAIDRLPPYDPSAAPADGDIPESFRQTDLGNAERLVHQHGKSIHYCYQRKQWLVWNGKCWQWDQGAKITSLAQKTVRTIYIEAANEDNYEERKALASHAKTSESNSRIKAMIEQAEPMVAVDTEDLDSHSWKLNCMNGTVDLKTGKLLSHNRDDLITMTCPVDYYPDAHSDLWDKFINKVCDGKTDVISYLQRCIGYTLTGDTREQCLFFCWGTGMNGKTTFLNAFREILSLYSLQTNTDMFMTAFNPQKQGHSEDVANLYGKRYVVGSEIEEGRRLAVTKLKQMTGGERVRASHKFEREIEFDVTYKIWLNGNHRPDITDTTYAIWRRVKLIPFNVKITKEEDDKQLKYKLRSQFPALLAWAVQGCLDWQKSGLREPMEVRNATEIYRLEQDVLGDFIEDCCILEILASIPKSELRRQYETWCKDNNTDPVSQRTFRTRLIEKGVTDGKSGSVRYWKGITLNSIVPDGTENVPDLDTNGTTGTEKSVKSLYEGKLKNFTENSVPNVSMSQKGDIPDYPTHPCHNCGCGDYWLTDWNGWLCSHCHPKPEGSNQ